MSMWHNATNAVTLLEVYTMQWLKDCRLSLEYLVGELSLTISHVKGRVSAAELHHFRASLFHCLRCAQHLADQSRKNL